MAKCWKQFERDVAILFRRWFPDARRGLQYQDGDYTPDVVKTPFYVECKSGKTYIQYRDGKKNKSVNPHDLNKMLPLHGYYYDRMELWRDDGGEDQPVVVVWKQARKPIHVTLLASLWKELVGETVGTTNYLLTVTWNEFAAALDRTYPIQLQIKEIANEKTKRSYTMDR